MKSNPITWSAAGAVVLVLTLTFGPAAAQQQQPVGAWHGVLETPAGPLTVVFRISEEPDGTLSGGAESPDQAPGQEAPLEDVRATEGRLTFSIPRWSASYEGDWVHADMTWSGTFTQGLSLPLVLRRGEPPRKPVFADLDGTWRGVLLRNGVELRLILRVSTGEGGTNVTLDSPDVGAMGLPVTEFSLDGANLGFTVPAAGVEYRGVLSPDGEEVTGTWRRSGQADAAVTFSRTSGSADRPERPRPQTPREPFPYRSADVRFDNPWHEGVELAGTLTLPEGGGPFPAAVLISGSGPQDRDETIWGHKPFAVLADHLTRQGIAVLRYDDRGFGESTGDYGTATSADFATDAAAAARYLASRPEVDADAIGLVGHSEGGMIGPLAATAHAEIAFLVLLAGPGTDTRQLRRTQYRLMRLSQGVTEEEIEASEPWLDRLTDAAASAPDHASAAAAVRELLTPAVLEAIRVPRSQVEPLIAELTSEWMRYFVKYDPAPVLARVRVPVLALNGSLDIQVPPEENLRAIEDALEHNPDVTIIQLNGLNHMFQTAETGAIGEIRDLTETIAPVVLETVSDWITARFGSQEGDPSR